MTAKNRAELLTQLRLEPHEDLPAYCWPGGYPLFYITKDCSVICPDCANCQECKECEDWESDRIIVGQDANWENPDMYCDHCSTRIESAYAEDEDIDDETGAPRTPEGQENTQ
jgi:hypothetical protein